MLEDPNMAHYKISNRVSHLLIFYLLVFDRIHRRFSTAWYGTVRFSTVHFWGGFHWVQYLVPGIFLVPPRLRFQVIRTITKT